MMTLPAIDLFEEPRTTPAAVRPAGAISPGRYALQAAFSALGHGLGAKAAFRRTRHWYRTAAARPGPARG